ncbi:MAG: hypothetical protein HPY79_07450, partial [Bacteroidales bacterium]|nr:hypothetical protein [Bacteroidales bacterium]
MKALLTYLMITIIGVQGYSQPYFYSKSDTSPIMLLINTPHYLIYRHSYSNYIYKMDYNKVLVDSIHINGGFMFGDVYNNEKIILAGNNNNFNLIYAILDTNLNILTYDSLNLDLLVSNLLLYENRFFILGERFNILSSFISSFSYDGHLIDTLFIGNSYSFAYKLNNNAFNFGYENNSNTNFANLNVITLDTSLNIIQTDTVPKFNRNGNDMYECLFNNKVAIAGNYFDYNSSQKNIAIGIFDKQLDTVYSFDFFNLGDHFPTINGLVTNKNNIFVSCYLNLDYNNTLSSKDTICITNYDSLLNVKWRRFIGGDNNYHAYNIFPAPDGGCIFSMTIHDLLTDTYDGVIVWLDSLGNQVLSIPENANQLKKFLLYPNPGTNELNVLLPENNKNTTLELVNSLGIVCKEEQFTNDKL